MLIFIRVSLLCIVLVLKYIFYTLLSYIDIDALSNYDANFQNLLPTDCWLYVVITFNGI
jgi:hypothetical protein